MSTTANIKFDEADNSGEDDLELFQALRTNPQYAWPTIAMFVLSVAALISSTIAATIGAIPMSVGVVINSLCAYAQFSVFHDASHRAVSRNITLNDFLGYVSLGYLSPFMPFSVLKFVHMIHHRDANGDIDVGDTYVKSGPIWQLPFRWLTLDLSYMRVYASYWQRRPRSEKVIMFLFIAATMSLLIALATQGYAWELFWLWFVPTRVAVMLISVVFVYLPHYPHTVTHRQDPYKASNNRIGLEWLYNPLFMYQNYHLVHHLYPQAPFYRMQKLWDARKKFHMSHDPALVSPLGRRPNNM